MGHVPTEVATHKQAPITSRMPPTRPQPSQHQETDGRSAPPWRDLPANMGPPSACLHPPGPRDRAFATAASPPGSYSRVQRASARSNGDSRPHMTWGRLECTYPRVACTPTPSDQFTRAYPPMAPRGDPHAPPCGGAKNVPVKTQILKLPGRTLVH